MLNQVAVAELKINEVNEFPDHLDIRDGELFGLALSNNTTALTHGIHRFPAKFIPHVPAWALDNYGSGAGKVVVDPFVGSGTTLVEAATRGIRAIGLDIDPLAQLMARAKVSNATPASVASALHALLGRVTGTGPIPREVPMSGVENPLHWFTPRALADLAELRREILGLPCTDSVREFLLVCFSSVIRWVSNADDQSQKTYVSGTRPKAPPPVLPTFRRFAEKAVVGLERFASERSPFSATDVKAPREGIYWEVPYGSVDLVVASPPYLDSVDYMYNFMLEYFWLGPLLGVSSRRDFNHRRRGHIGAKSPLDVGTVSEAATALALRVPPGRREAAVGYLTSMQAHFREAVRCLKPGGRYVLVVGNSQTTDELVPVHEMLLSLAAAEGLSLERYFGYRIRRHYMKFPRMGHGGIILLDWVLVLRRTGSKRSSSGVSLPRPWAVMAPEAVAH